MRNIVISKSKLLLVEGSHEKQFFAKLLKSMGIDDIQVEPVGGDRLFKPNIANLRKLQDYSRVKSIGIVRDADNSFEDALRSVQGALKEAGLPVPDQPMMSAGTDQRVVVFITPDNSNGGDLEDLLIASVQGDPVLGCVDEYFDCIRTIQGNEHPHLSKARVQVYLAKEPDGDIHMGIASQRDIWEWTSSAFDTLKTFVQSL
jgi:hypothetical protein